MRVDYQHLIDCVSAMNRFIIAVINV